MKPRSMVFIVGLIMVLWNLGCGSLLYPKEQRTLDRFVAAMKKEDYKTALSYCYKTEHVKLKSGMELIYFQVIEPTGNHLPDYLGGPNELDAYPGAISGGVAIESIFSWTITGAAKDINLHLQEYFPKAPVGCYVLKTRAFGLIGFVRINGQPKICFIELGP